MELLFEAITSLARANVPVEIADVLMGARLTALTKPDGGVRGIATGSSLRQLVARILARQFMGAFEKECAPFQYALSTRAGTDCVGHLLRASTDRDPTSTVLSVDGIGAYDHVLRSAMLGRLLQMPAARAILPFVRLSYGAPSSYTWVDCEGQQRTVTQAEGGEQGDPLMPLLFSIGIQGALEEVATSLAPEEHLCAFLDDIYLLCPPERVVPLYKLLSETLARVAGIRLHQGKTKVWNKAGRAPEDVQELGPEAWQTQGLKVLGTPIGTPEFVSQKMNDRIEDERRLWETIPVVPDLQCAWQLLVQSANPRANHSLRTMPPSSTAEYARAHDDGMWQTVEIILQQTPGTEVERAFARELATLPMRMGGLGLRSATRCAESAFWASWADALPMIRERTPQVVEMVVHAMNGEQPTVCLGELQEASRRLDREGFWWRPSWPELIHGKRPPQNTTGEPGEWQHGWQYWASSISDAFFRKTQILSVRPASCRAHLRSRTRGWSSARLRSHGTRVRDSPSPVPDHAFGKAPVASPDR